MSLLGQVNDFGSPGLTRGGCWANEEGLYVRPVNRNGYVAWKVEPHVGFRTHFAVRVARCP